MDLHTAITGRRAVRDYTNLPGDEKLIHALIAAATQAPSAVNEQPWTFTVVRDQGTLDRISHEAKSHMLTALAANPHAEHLRPHLTDPQFHIFYHAPTLILISARREGPWIVEDCALAAENLRLSAYAAGLGSCWIGFAQGFLNTPEGKAVLDIPSHWVPVAPIVIGHPKTAPNPIPRNEPEIRWIG